MLIVCEVLPSQRHQFATRHLARRASRARSSRYLYTLYNPLLVATSHLLLFTIICSVMPHHQHKKILSIQNYTPPVFEPGCQNPQSCGLTSRPYRATLVAEILTNIYHTIYQGILFFMVIINYKKKKEIEQREVTYT